MDMISRFGLQVFRSLDTSIVNSYTSALHKSDFVSLVIEVRFADFARLFSILETSKNLY